MNKQSHRIVFNKSRGQLMVVAETASGDHGSAGPREAAAPSSSLSLSLRHLTFCLWTALGMVTFVTPAAAQIVSDPNAPGNQRPTVLPSPGGAPVVNIQTPSAAGVSRNTYTQFDVNQQGAVLNNSRTGARTQVAGQVGANPWLAKGTARVILNEVNSSNPSQLRGYVEVAGDKAQVVIANPSGITCDGCGFINANRATLTTGTPVVNGGSLDAYRVERGTVRVQGAGMDSSGANYTDIIARSVEVNGKTYAKDLRVTAGANLVNADNTRTQRIQGQGEAPQVAIDTGQLGGMYANKIHLVGTEAGVGVRHAGQMGASAGEVVISADGQILSSGSILAEGNVTLQGRRIEVSKGSIASRNGVSALAQELRIKKEALLAAGLQEDGTISGNGSLRLQADDIQAHGQHVAAGEMEVKGGKVNLSDGLFEAKMTMRAEGDSLTTDRATLAAKQLLMAAHVLSNRGGQLQQTGSGNSQLRARELDNTEGKILLQGESSLDVGKIDNTRGQIGADGTLTIRTQSLDNTGGHVVAKKLQLDSGDAALRNTGKIEAEELRLKGRSLTNTAGGELLANIGRIEVQDLLNQGLVNIDQLRVDARTVTNSGQVYATTLSLGADRLTNEEGGVIAARQDLQLGIKDKVNNEGEILSAGKMRVGGSLSAEGKAEGTAGLVTNTGGLIEAQDRLDLVATQTINLRRGDRIGTIRGDTLVLPGAVHNEGHILGVDVQYDPTRYTERRPTNGLRAGAAQSEGTASEGGRSLITATRTLNGTNRADGGLDAQRAREAAARAAAPAPVAANAPAPAPEAAPTGEMQRASVSTRIPSSRLFTADPAGATLIKSDERFSGDGKNWLGSDWLLQALGVDPKTLPQRLGDGYYEQRLLRDQVNQLTGHQFLAGHISNEAEYKALLENAVKAAQELGLKLGQALTPEQVKALKTDIVWLEQREVVLPNGQKVQALVPQLYARVQDDDPTRIELKPNSFGVATGSQVVVDVAGQYTQQGTLVARSGVSLKADELMLQGNVVSRDIHLEASGNVVNDGAQLVAGRNLTVRAGQDILSTSTLTSDGAGGIKIDRLAAWTAGNSETGQLSLEAGRDVRLNGSLVQNGSEGQGAATQIKAGRDVQLGTITVSEQTHSASGRNRRDVSTTMEVGTQVQTKGDLHVEAGRDIVGRAATLQSEKGAVVGNAKQDIRLEAGQQTTVLDEVTVSVRRSLFKKTTTTTVTHVEDTQAIGSSVSGAKVDLRAGRDIVADGAQVVSDERTQLIAGRDVTLDAAQTETRENVQQHRKTSGIFSQGSALIWGRKHENSDDDKVSENQSGTRVASLKGDVLVQAGRRYTQQGSEVAAPEGTVQITAQQVHIGEAATRLQATQDVRTRTSGLKLEVSSPILSAAQSIHGLNQASRNTNDPRMLALAAFSMGMNGYNGANSAATAYSQGSATSGASVTLTASTSRSHSHAEQEVNSGAGSSVVGRNVTIRAVHDPVNPQATFTPTQGMDITIQGSNVRAQEVASLQAEGQVQLLAGRDTLTQSSTNSSGSAGVGVGASANNGASVGVRVEASYAEGDSLGHSTTHRNSHVEAGRGVQLRSGGDTTLIGAVVTAPKVEADIGGRLVMRSPQDTRDHGAEQGSVSGGATVGFGVDVNVSVSASQLKHDFASVGEQTAIRAGDQGFQITARGGTVLEGAQITSTQAAIDNNLNRFSSPSILVQDVTNRSSTEGQAFGVGGSASGRGQQSGDGQQEQSTQPSGNNERQQQGSGRPSYSGGVGSIDEQATSVSTAGISGIAGDQSARTGQASTSLANTFNEANAMANLQAQVTITQAFSAVAPQAVAEFAQMQQRLAAQQMRAAMHEPNPERRAQMLQEAQDALSGWGDGGRYRVAAHTVMGALGAGWEGAVGAGGAAALHDDLEKLQKSMIAELQTVGFKANTAKLLTDATMQLGVMTLGAASGQLSVTQWGLAVDINNRQLHDTEKRRLRDLARQLAAQAPESQQVKAEARWYDVLEQAALARVDDQAKARWEKFISDVAATRQPGLDGNFRANDVLAVLDTANREVAKLAAEHTEMQTSRGTRQMFSANREEMANPVLFADSMTLRPGYRDFRDRWNQRTLASLGSPSGMTQPDYRVEEFIVGGWAGKGVIQLTGVTVRSLDALAVSRATSALEIAESRAVRIELNSGTDSGYIPPTISLFGVPGSSRIVEGMEPLLMSGHAGYSFNYGGRISGFNPIYTDPMEAYAILRNGGSLPGQVVDDTQFFIQAAQSNYTARGGLGRQQAYKIDIPVTRAEFEMAQAIDKGRGLNAPLNGFDYAYRVGAGCTAPYNCVTYISTLGVRLPESSGRISSLIPEMLNRGALPWR